MIQKNESDLESPNDDDQKICDDSRRRGSWFGHFAWYACRVLLVVVVVLGLVGGFVYNSAQQAPEFHRAAMITPPEELDTSGKEFEARVFKLQNSTHEQGAWEATFTDKQLNGWLGSDLPEKFPDTIPKSILNPRIAIEQDAIKIAFKVNSRRLKGYVVAVGDVFCSHEKNQIAIRIKSAKLGIAPIPIGIWANSITKVLRKTGTTTTWTEIDGDPVVLITLPEDLTNRDAKRIVLESVRLLDGKLVLAGVTISTDH